MIRSISPRRAVKNKLYAKVKRQWWKEQCRLWRQNGFVHPTCRVAGCWKYAEASPHHIIPKSVRPDLYAVEENFLAVCWQCHMKIHAERAWAFARGYLGHSWDDLKELAERRKEQHDK